MLGVMTLATIAVIPAPAEAQGSSDAELPPVTRIDAELANACIRAGESKAFCICETRLLRRTLDPHDYAPSMLLQTASHDNNLHAAKATLVRKGVSESEIKALDSQRRRIVATRIEPVCTSGAHPETRLEAGKVF